MDRFDILRRARTAGLALGVLLALGACSTTSTAPNLAPIADAGLDVVAAPGDTVRLDGSASHDPDGSTSALAFDWRPITVPAGSTASLAGADTATPTFTADVVGSYVFLLRVRDGRGSLSAPDAVAVTVLPFLEVARVIPGDESAGVAATAPVAVFFTEPVQPSTVSPRAIGLASVQGATVDGAVSLAEGNRMAVFTPLAPLAPGTRYTMTVGIGIRNLRGQSLPVRFQSSFGTAAGADTVGPAVLSVDPPDGASEVGAARSIVLTMSEPVDPASVTAGTVTLDGGSGTVAVARDVGAAGLLVTLTPAAPLEAGASYDVRLGAGVTDLAGNAAAAFASRLTVAAAADTTRPRIVWADPADGFSGVEPKATVMIAFSEPMDPGSVSAGLTLGNESGVAVPGVLTLAPDRTVATLAPTQKLAFLSRYAIRVTTAATDVAGNPLDGDGAGGDFTSHFTTTAEIVDLDHFRVAAAPTRLTVGEATTVSVTAKKIDDSTLLDYQNIEPVLLVHGGTAARCRWEGPGVTDVGGGVAELAAGAFVNGVALVYLADEAPDVSVAITATEQDTTLARTGSTSVTGTSVTWEVGPLAALAVVAEPTSLAAGNPTNVTISAADAFGNVIRGYQNTQALALSHDGSATATTWAGVSVQDLGNGAATLQADAFYGGQAVARLRDNAAEGPVTITVHDPSSGLTGSTAQSATSVTWVAGALASFEVVASPRTALAGDAVAVTITARDFGGNVIGDYQSTAGIDLTQTGLATAVTWGGTGVTGRADGTATLAAGAFASGVATLSLRSTRAQSGVVVTATENDTGAHVSGSTAATGTNPSWAPGPVDHFDVAASATSLLAGRAVALTITARDAWGNAVTTYANASAVTLHQSGVASGKVWADDAALVVPGGADAGGDNGLGAGAFALGVATVSLRDDVAEGPLTVTVTEHDAPAPDATGASPGLAWAPAEIDHFRVTADPTALVAGDTTVVTVTARDRFDNLITTYDNGAAMQLTETGAPGGKLWTGGCVGSNADGSGTLASGCWTAGLATVSFRNTVAEGPVSLGIIEGDSGFGRSGATAGSGTSPTWSTGPLDHFGVSASVATLTAGQPVTLVVTAHDQFANVLPSYANTAALTLHQGGTAAGKTWAGSACLVTPGADANGDDALGAGCFASGVATVTLTDRVAEGPFTVTVTEHDAPAPDATGTSGSITWTAGDIDHFLVTAAPTARTAGDATSVSIAARDKYDNTIPTYENVLPIELATTGAMSGKHWQDGCATDHDPYDGKAALSADCWVGGVVTGITLQDTVAEGPVSVVVRELDTGLERTGRTSGAGDVTWAPGVLTHFSVTATPATLVAGQATTVTVAARDVYENVLTGYSYPEPSPLGLTQSGATTGKIWDGPPCLAVQGGANLVGNNQLAFSTGGTSCWTAGQVTFSFIDTVAEGPLAITVSDGTSSGTSGNLVWSFGALDHFRVEGSLGSGTSATAGTPATVAIRAEDLYANLITTYTNGTTPVTLTQNGTPSRVTWSGPNVTNNGDGTGALAIGSFASGVAAATLTDTRAEGPVIVTVTDPSLLRTGNTSVTNTSLTWVPGGLGKLGVDASPTSLPAAQSSTLTITAQDAYGNAIPGHTLANDVVLTPSCNDGACGALTWTPASTIPAGTSFDVQGTITVSLADATPDVMSVTATQQTSGITGTTATSISWTTSSCTPPTAVPSVGTQNRCAIGLTGASSLPGSGAITTWAWTVLTVPTGSAVTTGSLTGADTATPSFTADLYGTYAIKLAVTNACGGTSNDTLVISYALTPSVGDIVIDELVTWPRTDWDGSGTTDARDQYVELLNKTTCSIDLTGWDLRYKPLSGAFTDIVMSSPPTPNYRSIRFSDGASTLAGFRPGTYLVVQNPANINRTTGGLPNVVYLELWTAQSGGANIDSVEVGDDPRGDTTPSDCAPAGNANGGKNTGAADECVARYPDGKDSNLVPAPGMPNPPTADAADFVARRCTYDAPNL